MNYIVKGRFYIADEDYTFHSKLTDNYSKRIALPKPEMLEYYDVIPEPIEEIEENEDFKEVPLSETY